jgi:hypothetical protein
MFAESATQPCRIRCKAAQARIVAGLFRWPLQPEIASKRSLYEVQRRTTQ